MNAPKEKQFTLWQLMKGVAIAALLTSALVPLIRKSDVLLANPGLFVVVMALTFLIQAPFLFLPMHLASLILRTQNYPYCDMASYILSGHPTFRGNVAPHTSAETNALD